MKKIEQILKQLESGQELLKRLEKIADKLDETFGETSLLELLEEEIQSEKPYAADGSIRISATGAAGLNTDLGWSFQAIVDDWFDVYKDDADDDGPESLREMGAQFRKLAEMFDAAAAKIDISARSSTG